MNVLWRVVAASRLKKGGAMHFFVAQVEKFPAMRLHT
jgi:hypothetical protein